jgi:hypothetical protein
MVKVRYHPRKTKYGATLVSTHNRRIRRAALFGRPKGSIDILSPENNAVKIRDVSDIHTALREDLKEMEHEKKMDLARKIGERYAKELAVDTLNREFRKENLKATMSKLDDEEDWE